MISRKSVHIHRSLISLSHPRCCFQRRRYTFSDDEPPSEVGKRKWAPECPEVSRRQSKFEGACPEARVRMFLGNPLQKSTAASHRLPVHHRNASLRSDCRPLPWPSPVRAAGQHSRSCSGTLARVKRNSARPRAASTRGEADRISVISLPRSTSSSRPPSLAGGLSPC